MKNALKTRIILPLFAMQILQGMEKNEEKLIPGIPTPPQEKKIRYQMLKLGWLERQTEAIEDIARTKAAKLELKQRQAELEIAKSIYASFDSKNPEELKKLHERVGGRARKDGVSLDDAEAALTVIVHEFNETKKVAAILNRKRMKASSERYLRKKESPKKETGKNKKRS